jgi:hypothetical protein
MAAGLPGEALEHAERAVAGHLDAGHAFDAAESRRIAARAALAAGELGRASEMAATAQVEFGRQRRRTWAASAWQVESAARYAEGERTTELLRGLTNCVARLEQAGRVDAPQEARLQAARPAAALGRRARLSLDGGSARSLLIRAEQWRAISQRHTPARPPRSGQLAELLTRLRHVRSQVNEDALGAGISGRRNARS